MRYVVCSDKRCRELITTDPTNLVHKSIQKNEPILVVTLNYRLNMFAFGDGSGEKNLALQDQRAALDFVQRYIGGFGGDPVRTSWN